MVLRYVKNAYRELLETYLVFRRGMNISTCKTRVAFIYLKNGLRRSQSGAKGINRMAHELTIRDDGKVEMAYLESSGMPWHRLGTPVAAGQDRTVWRVAAGLEWKAQRGFVRYAVERGVDPSAFRTIEDRVVLFRSDNGDHLGIVSDSYKVVQPAAIQDFFFDMAEAHGFTIETMGSLFGGRKVWTLARAGADSYVVDQRDAIRPYLLGATSLDGSMNTEFRKTAVQVVCNNTLRLALSSGGDVVRVPHSTTFRPADVRLNLGIEIGNDLELHTAHMRKLACAKIPYQAIETATVALFKGLKRAEDTTSKDYHEARNALACREVLTRYRTGGLHAGMDGVQGTVYGWINAVTDYVDHAASVHSGQYSQDRRFESAMFGKGADLKAKALEFADVIANDASTSIAMSGVDLNKLFNLK